MPRASSLNKKKEFDILFKKGKRLYSKNFSLLFLESSSLKFGLIISKKNAKRANRRNYSRRVLREIIRTEILPKLLNTNFHIVLIAKCDLKNYIKNNSFTEIKEEVVEIINKIK